MGKKNYTKPSPIKFLLKLGASLVGGAILGEVISPLTGPVSGPALGIAAVGLPVWGFKPSYLKYAALPAVTVQAIKSTQSSTPMIAAKASLAGATRALRASNAPGSGDDALAKARALAGGR